MGIRHFRVSPLAAGFFGLVALAAAAFAVPVRRQVTEGAGFTAHEWGTFTTIASADGQPSQWLPVDLVSRPSELPAFVEHFRSAGYKAVLRGTVRMETPVIYFYSAHDARVSVHVSFAKGLITEWYPHATRLTPSPSFQPETLYGPHEDGSITWDSVTISPSQNAAFPHETSASHYYAARETSATPLSIVAPSGEQPEKFLFYRGVSIVDPPLTAKALPSGSIQIDSAATQPVPALILFERRGDTLGYRVVTSPQPHTVLEPSSRSGTLDSLRSDLEDLLAAQGLFRDEAHAMVETWRDSWFDEGSRLFYIVPRAYVDSILPLSITPRPAQLARVFVGRIELVTPATERSIEAAVASRDAATLKKYGRFLYPILNIMADKLAEPAQAQLYDDVALALR